MHRYAVQWLSEFCVWLDQTAVSQTIQSKSWIVPSVQTVHILSIAVVMTSALMIDLRLIGFFARDQSFERVSARFLPFIWWPLLVLLLTGTVMIVGEPARSLKNPVFQLKMVLLAAAMFITWLLWLLGRNPAFGEAAAGRRVAAPVMALASLLLWTGIIFAGRWIAYWA
jgi:Family of unknown function (DUF6644)